jgi:hypothetical protein
MRTFYSRYEQALRKTATTEVSGRLRGATDVAIEDFASPPATKTPKANYELFGPGDVQRLAAGAITRRFPAPNASDAEVTKTALVEFAAADLPWRYTPKIASSTGLRPWIVLIVGQRVAGDIILRRDGRVTLGLVAQNNHKLVDSAQWAHVQQVVDHGEIGRIIAPPRQAPGLGAGNLDYIDNAEYVACLVPAFKADGTDSWNGTQPVTCDLYDWWTFRTGPKGDFRDLAAKLRKADLDAILQNSGKPFGRAEVQYKHRALPAKITKLQTAGALKLPPDGVSPDPAEKPVDQPVAKEVKALTVRTPTPDGRGVITAPRYDGPFADANAVGDPAAGGWIDQMQSDPRMRGAAGLGAWNAIAWQDKIADAAATKAGDLAIARARINHVAFGVELSRSLWRRRLPVDPVDRLAVLAPSLSRLVTTSGEPVLDAIAGRTPGLTRALFSSAARRVLRPGPARTALTTDGAAPFGKVLRIANTCEARKDPARIRQGDADPQALLERAIHEAVDDDRALADAILTALGRNPSPGRVSAALRALAPDETGRPNRDAIAQFLNGRSAPEIDRTMLEWPAWMNEHGRPQPCRPIRLEDLAKVVADAIDPTVARPPVVERVLSTLPGITHIGPVEIEPELDLPLWSFLSDNSPDWMLPGAGDLRDGDVVGLSTNPAFVESLLVGANHQTTAELRWRNVPLTTRWSPLRKFWQRAGGEYDVLPIKAWPEASALGSKDLVPGGRDAEAVVVFKTSLFKRYPATVVYLYPSENDWDAPEPGDDLEAGKILPTFTGTIGKDITFFGFPVAPEKLKTHWVVLEEPPSGYRFYQAAKAAPKVPPDSQAPAASSSNFAYQRFALPVRVLIGPLLEDQP